MKTNRKTGRASLRLKASWLAGLAAGWVLSPQNGLGTVFTVTNLNDGGPGSLRDLIAASVGGDTITFGVGGVTVLFGDLVIDHSLNILGPGATYLGVSGGGNGRVFSISSSNSPVILISDLTISDGLVRGADGIAGSGDGGRGEVASGGGISVSSTATLTLRNCVLTRNRALGGRGAAGAPSEVTGYAGGSGGSAYGGAIFSLGLLVISKCTLSANSAQGGAGGAGGDGLAFGGNGGVGGAGEGGAIYNQGSCPLGVTTCDDLIVNCTISGNTASGGGGGAGGGGTQNGGNGGDGGDAFGGGMFDFGSSSGYRFKIVNCTIASSFVSGGDPGGGGSSSPTGSPGSAGLTGIRNGGGIYNEGTLTVCDCYLVGNSAISSGGGIYNKYGASLTVISSCLYSNGASYGGGIYNDVNGTLRGTNCTLAGNASTYWGGAIANYDGLLTLNSCTLSQNRCGPAGGGAGLFTDFSGGYPPVLRNCLLADNVGGSGPDSYGPVASSGYNLVSRGDVFTQGFSGPGDQVGTAASPINAQLGALQSNGGPTLTMALLAGSPAIDQGNSAGLTTDQRGGRRPVDEPGVANAPGGDGSDIGAYERDSLFAITSTTPTNSWMQVCFRTESRNSYQVQYAPDPSSGHWTTLISNVAGTGGIVCVTDFGPLPAHRVYRVQLLP